MVSPFECTYESLAKYEEVSKISRNFVGLEVTGGKRWEERERGKKEKPPLD